MKKNAIILFILLMNVFYVYPQLIDSTKHIISDHLSALLNIEVADLNNNGSTDILVTSGTHKLLLFENLDNNGFLPQQIDEYIPNSFHLSDMDNDQDEDIVGYIGDEIVVYYNNGKGQFEKELYPTDENINLVAIGDINSDCFNDIIFITHDGYLYMLTSDYPNNNQKKTPFFKKIMLKKMDFTLKSSSSENLLRIADINNDGLNDVVIAYQNYFYFLENKGEGDFEDNSFNFQKFIKSFEICDYNFDGYKDILIQNGSTGGGLYLYVNNNNTFNYSIVLPDSFGIESFELNDVDKDGFADVLFIEPHKIGWYKMSENFSMEYREVIYEDADYLIYHFACLDVDTDGYKDLVCFNNESYKIFKNKEGIEFELSLTRLDMARISDYCIGDFNGDKYLDIVASFAPNLNFHNQGPDGIFLFSNHHGNGFENPVKVSDLLSDRVIAGDINLDGCMDFVNISKDNVENKYFFRWFENDSIANFSSHYISSAFDKWMSDYTLVDFDFDGYLDIVGFAHAYDNYLFWIRNKEGKGFEKKEILYTGHLQQLSHFDVADITQNGFLDLIVWNNYDDLYLLKNTDGTSFIIETIDSERDFNDFFLSDLDNDGKKDIVVNIAEAEDHNITGWYKNKGGGNYSDLIKIDIVKNNVYSSAQTLSVDFDNDGIEDLVSKTIDSIRYYSNDGSGNFTKKSSPLIDSDIKITSFNDLDNDQDQDMLFVKLNPYSTLPDRLCWYENQQNTKTENYIGICEGDSIYFNGNWISKPGSYNMHFNSQHGGDSVFTLQVEVFQNPIQSFDIVGPQTAEQYKDIDYLITSENESVTYNWEVENGLIKSIFKQTNATINWRNAGKGLATVWAIDRKTKCFMSNTIDVIIDDFSDNNFYIYPNPANSTIYMPAISDSIYAEFYNLNGILVKVTSESVVDISLLSKGLYIIKMFNPDGKLLAINKIVLQ